MYRLLPNVIMSSLLDKGCTNRFDVPDALRDEIEFLNAAYSDSISIDFINEKGVQLRLFGNIFASSGVQSITLHLPPCYPSVCLSILSIQHSLSSSRSDALQQQLLQVITNAAKLENPVCLDIIHCCSEFASLQPGVAVNAIETKDEKLCDKDIKSAASIASCSIEALPPSKSMRAFIYFHHIKSPKKKREIRNQATNLQLGGVWKGC